MARKYVFVDEAGDFTFQRKQGASLYFMVGTASMGSCEVGDALLSLRRELMWEGIDVEQFHATTDRQPVRDRVFSLLATSDIRVDATILDKTKTHDHLRQNPVRFYKQALFLHFKYLIPRVAGRHDDLTVVASSLQIKRHKGALGDSVRDVVDQVSRTRRFMTAFHKGATDPCLQVADYVTWAIQRKYERNDDRSYKLIEHLVKSEFQPFAKGAQTFY